eukprot:Em0006g698a
MRRHSDVGMSSTSGTRTKRTITRKLSVEHDECPTKVVAIGICAMEKKVSAPPMQSILNRLRQQDYINTVHFSDDVILNKPIEEWPQCDCLISFYSKGFPLDKAIAYVNLRHPFVINDLEMQYNLMDRRKVYEILTHHGVEVPKYAVATHTKDGNIFNFSEVDDTVEVNGVVFHKPFVEKPVSAEDHNIYIYFPSDYGGGSQRLFRKSIDHSSQYSRESNVRSTGSYIYEEFMATDGADVKVYTVGVDYAHAEARKSPALDGRVERDDFGKEKRFPVLLTAAEKLIARKVVLAFKQTVCGFDLLRANGKSYVCDVNGFSFVKNSQKYYDDCAQILLETIISRVAPVYMSVPRIPASAESTAETTPTLKIAEGNLHELRCVVGIIRHGDRTPKQKMKMVVTHQKFFTLFEELNGFKTGKVKLKKPKLLQKVLDIARWLLDEAEKNKPFLFLVEEKVHKLHQLKAVLEMHGYFSGINRKVQFKLIPRRPSDRRPQLLLILKWGGELTSVGQRQAEELGRAFRCMYPGGEGEYASLPGSGFLRLHSTYRHDLKVYASDEGRVQMTAAAFTKGLLELEGNVASILVHLVKRDQHATAMLDHSATDAGTVKDRVKARLDGLLMTSGDITEEIIKELVPTNSVPLIAALRSVKNFHESYDVLHQKINSLREYLIGYATSNTCPAVLYHEETIDMMINRWTKLDKDFKPPDGKFDITKIPDIYDCVKYDLLHNSQLCPNILSDIYRTAIHLADIVIPQEYGITKEEKLNIATQVCQPLLKKIKSDFDRVVCNEVSDIIHRLDARNSEGVVSPDRHVRTRLYFTSESHVHAMANVLKYGGLFEDLDNAAWREGLQTISATPELNYMTQIVFLLYEDTQQPPDSPQRYTVSIRFSPGIRHRERFLSDRSPADDKSGSYCDRRVSIQDNGHKSQTGCTSSCNHSVVLNQRLSRLTSQAGVEKRASPFRKLSHMMNLIDLQKDYEQMQNSPLLRNISRRLSSSELNLPFIVKEYRVLRKFKSETTLPVVTDTALDEEDDICTPQLHSPQLSNSLSSASIHGWSRLPCQK